MNISHNYTDSEDNKCISIAFTLLRSQVPTRGVKSNIFFCNPVFYETSHNQLVYSFIAMCVSEYFCCEVLDSFRTF